MYGLQMREVEVTGDQIRMLVELADAQVRGASLVVAQVLCMSEAGQVLRYLSGLGVVGCLLYTSPSPRD